MRTFYYVHTGHRIGLDRFRRAAAILGALDNDDITLLTSDFRIAQIARDFGIKDCVGLDVVRNIPQIAHHGDKIIFDSEEANPIMLDDMRAFFSSFIRISDDENDEKEPNEFLLSPYLSAKDICTTYAINDKYFGDFEKTTKLSFFFGDDDYEKDLEKNLNFLELLEPALQLGFYYFLDYEDMLKDKFKKIFEFEDYDEMITSSEILLTASPQAVLETLASGGKPIYFQRKDYTDNFNKLFDTLNIPIIYNYDKNRLSVILGTINNITYQKIENNSNKTTHFIKEYLNI
jgi:hypothetical protein